MWSAWPDWAGGEACACNQVYYALGHSLLAAKMLNVLFGALAAAVMGPLFVFWNGEPLYKKWGYEVIVFGVLISRVVSSVWA